MKAVVNTSVLIAFGKLCYLGLLKHLFDELFVAKSVLEEVRGSGVYAEVERLMEVGFARVAEASKVNSWTCSLQAWGGERLRRWLSLLKSMLISFYSMISSERRLSSKRSLVEFLQLPGRLRDYSRLVGVICGAEHVLKVVLRSGV